MKGIVGSTKHPGLYPAANGEPQRFKGSPVSVIREEHSAFKLLKRGQSEGRLDTGWQGKSLPVQGSANNDPWLNLGSSLF